MQEKLMRELIKNYLTRGVNPKPDGATHVVLSGSLHIKVWVKREYTEDGWMMWRMYTKGK